MIQATINVKDLAVAMDKIVHTAWGKAYAVLANGLIRVIDAHTLEMMTTNLECTVQVRLTTTNNIELPAGDGIFPVKAAQKFVKALPASEQITLSYGWGKFQLLSDRATWEISPDYPPEEMPPVPNPEEFKGDFEISITRFAEMLHSVAFAAATEDNRPVLNGVGFEIDTAQNTVGMVTADGYRLAYIKQDNVKHNPDTAFKETFIVPLNTIKILQRVLKGKYSQDETLRFSFSKEPNGHRIQFVVGNVIVTSILIDGLFPDWRKVRPQRFSTTARVNRDDFLKGIKIGVATIQSPRVPKHFRFTFKGGAPGAVHCDATINGATIKFSTDATVDGDETMQCGQNIAQIQEGLKAVGGEFVLLAFGAPSAPALMITCENGTELLFMPVTLDTTTE